MGGRSKSKSSTSSQSGANTSQLQAKGAAQQNSMMNGARNQYDSLSSSMLGSVFPAFGEMLQGGIGQMNSNPMGQFMGAALGLPIQMETPDFMQSFIDKYRPQEQAAQAPAEQAPYNVNDDMRARMGMGQPYGQYGPYGSYGVNR